MKYLAIIFALMILSSPGFCTQNLFDMKDGQKVKQYDKYGSYQGSYSKKGNTIKQYDKYGSCQGYYKQAGSTTKIYDKYGSYQGSYKK